VDRGSWSIDRRERLVECGEWSVDGLGGWMVDGKIVERRLKRVAGGM